MTTSSRLAAHRANAPAIEANAASDDDMDPQTQPMPDDDEDEDESEAGKKKDKPYMTEDDHKAALATARAEAVAEANTRMNAVLASEHYTGREKLAANLLANDALSADAIMSALSVAAKEAPANTTETDDEAARAEMRQNLAAEQPGATGQAAEDAPAAQADTTLVDNMKARYGLTK